MISRFLKHLAKLAWFLPGFLLWAAFPPMGEKTDVLFALAPLLWLSRRSDVKTSVRRWFLNGLFFWVATLSWMPAIVKNGGPWPLVALGWFGLAAYCAAYFAAFGYLSATYWQEAKGRGYGWRLLGVLVVEPVLWCGLELVRSRLLGGFAWNQLGVVAVNGGFGSPATLGGVYLCSAVVLLINGTFAGIAERVWKPEQSGFPRLKKFGTFETLLAFGLVFGIYQFAQFPQPSQPSQPSFKVALVQRNFPCVFNRGERQDPYVVYGKLLGNVAALQPDLVVLSESAMCEFGPVDQQGAARFAEWASQQCGGASVLTGGTRFGDGKEYNSAALYSFQPSQPSQPSQALSLYDKVHLVPFGEFIPGDKLIPVLQKLAPVGSCTPGELKTLPLAVGGRTIPVGVAICFEDTDSAQMRELAKKGAQALFFITNDSWFSHSDETVQHAWQAVARAVETGLPVVRVGNSGVSGTIAPDGRTSWLIGADGKPLVDRSGTMLDRIAMPGAGCLVPGAGCRVPGAGCLVPGSEQLSTKHQAPSTKHQAPSTKHLTPYVRLGDIPLAVAFALLILAQVMVKYKAHYEKRRNLPL